MCERRNPPGGTVVGQDISLSQKIAICLMVSPIWTELKKLYNSKLRDNIARF